MENEKIGDIYAKPQKNYISFNEALNLARQDEREKMQTEIGHLEYKIEGLQQALSRNKDEREKMTEQKVKDYFAGLNGKDTALVVLNYLLRGGITDDDLRGLRLQWIKDDREKMQGVELTFDEIEMIKNCLPYGVTNLKYCIKSNLDLYNKYLTWERILPNLLSKLTTEAT